MTAHMLELMVILNYCGPEQMSVFFVSLCLCGFLLLLYNKAHYDFNTDGAFGSAIILCLPNSLSQHKYKC